MSSSKFSVATTLYSDNSTFQGSFHGRPHGGGSHLGSGGHHQGTFTRGPHNGGGPSGRPSRPRPRPMKTTPRGPNVSSPITTDSTPTSKAVTCIPSAFCMVTI